MSETLAQKQTRLAMAAKAGDRHALAELMASMQGYIVAVRNKFGPQGLDRDDIEQACRVGILRALPTFDPARGAFAAAASNWIREEIRLLSDMMLRPVRVPRSRPLRLVQWKVGPMVRELVASGVNDRDAVETACGELGVSVKEYEQFHASRNTVRVAAGDDNEASEVYEPEHTPDPTEDLAASDREYAMSIVRAALTDLEWQVLSSYIVEGMTQEKIGKRIGGVSSERVRQRLATAIFKAREALLDEDLDAEALL
jgi:RNA polymerase sigma factor (sigma-70 family)